MPSYGAMLFFNQLVDIQGIHMSFAGIFTSVWAVPRAVLTDNLRILTSRTLLLIASAR